MIAHPSLRWETSRFNSSLRHFILAKFGERAVPYTHSDSGSIPDTRTLTEVYLVSTSPCEGEGAGSNPVGQPNRVSFDL